ncbi:hypothetical protein ACN47E_009327 [Coniothyrium glycines]
MSRTPPPSPDPCNIPLPSSPEPGYYSTHPHLVHRTIFLPLYSSDVSRIPLLDSPFASPSPSLVALPHSPSTSTINYGAPFVTDPIPRVLSPARGRKTPALVNAPQIASFMYAPPAHTYVVSRAGSRASLWSDSSDAHGESRGRAYRLSSRSYNSFAFAPLESMPEASHEDDLGVLAGAVGMQSRGALEGGGTMQVDVRDGGEEEEEVYDEVVRKMGERRGGRVKRWWGKVRERVERKVGKCFGEKRKQKAI